MAYTTIDNPFKYFNTVLYSGTGSSQAITGVGFQPDWIWFKCRSQNQNHNLFDVIRGSNKIIQTSTSNAEATSTALLTSFDSDGFTVNTDGGVNGSSQTYASWNWLAGGSGSSNSNGSITSTVSANTTAGFSIVSYTGTGSNATVGHGLGVAPKVLILKSRTRSDGQWTVGSDMLGWTKFLYLDANSAAQTFNIYQDTAPTSSVFSLSSDGGVNQSSGSMIGYAFAEKKGYSKFGSYTGNGETAGPFVYTGFKPAFVIIKYSNATESWYIYDNKRQSYNAQGARLRADDSEAEASSANFDFLSNGIKIRTSGSAANTSGGSYIYLAFAENPFVGNDSGTAVPVVAR